MRGAINLVSISDFADCCSRFRRLSRSYVFFVSTREIQAILAQIQLIQQGRVRIYSYRQRKIYYLYCKVFVLQIRSELRHNMLIMKDTQITKIS